MQRRMFTYWFINNPTLSLPTTQRRKRPNSLVKFEKRRKKTQPTSPPNICSRGVVSSLQPMRTKNTGDLQRNGNGQILYRFACDDCTSQNNTNERKSDCSTLYFPTLLLSLVRRHRRSVILAAASLPSFLIRVPVAIRIVAATIAFTARD